MKKLYTIFLLLFLGIVGFAARAVNVTVTCNNYWDKIEVRDGGAEGRIVELTGEQTAVLIEESLYIAVADDELIMLSLIHI